MSDKNYPRKQHLITGIVAGIFAAVIALQNTETVPVNFLLWKFELARIVLILLMLSTGFLLGYIFHSFRKK